MLPIETFKTVVENAPLFSIDLVVINEYDEMLIGKRLNAPAKDWWFVPGGRVLKGELLENAFKRISNSELGAQHSISNARFLGLFEHFYNDSFFDENTPTHYINAAYQININMLELELPFGEQHIKYKWVSIPQVVNDESIHRFSKVFIDQLKENSLKPRN